MQQPHRPNARRTRRAWTALLAAVALVAALLLPAAPAAAAPPVPADGWAATLAAWFNAWFAHPAADGAHPHLDPNGLNYYTPPPDDGGETHPHMDPDG